MGNLGACLCVRVRLSRSLYVEGCMAGVDVVVVAAVVRSFGVGKQMLVGRV